MANSSHHAFPSCGAISPAHRISPLIRNLYQRGSAFLLLAGLVFAFWWLVRLAALPLYRKMGEWGRHKIAIAVTGSSCLTIAGAFIIDLLLLALTLFVGQLLSDRLNGNNPTIAFQQSLFLNAFALIEFLKLFCGSFSARAFLPCGPLTSATRPRHTGACA